ncbi:MAG: type III-A CRISPR-associated protein Cas10/Csm1, partial [Syntrophaceae bacterium]|nr:type III-A CRISPR-associated protein Cas10/Csm1 [Syntrophaceae bacterium]
MNSTRKYEMIVGGLVHDAGKFFQRATSSDSELSRISKGMENMICPSFQGRYTHRHVLFTNEFCDRYLINLPRGLNKEVITNLASYHHRPGTAEQEIIHKADMLSSGMEREEDEEYAGGPTAFRKIRLRPVINEVRIQGQALPEKGSGWAYLLTDLHPEKPFPFPLKDEWGTSGGDLTGEYRGLWEGFIAAWGGNRVADPWGYVNRCLGILEHFTWCIPSATNVFPDISLYDHLKTTAAISACLAEAGNSPEPFLLAVTDFAGIQNYIYSIRSGAGGLARRLRARSFFVSLLGDSLVYRVLRSVDLPLTNCLISSGGKSYLLLPNTQKSSEVLSQVREEMDRWSIKETRGEIRVNIASVPISVGGLKDFSSSLDEASEALRREKEKPLKSFLQAGGKWIDFGEILEPLAIPDEGGLCDSCQKNGGVMRDVRGKPVPVCDRCHEDQEIGRILPKARFVAFYGGKEGCF